MSTQQWNPGSRYPGAGFGQQPFGGPAPGAFPPRPPHRKGRSPLKVVLLAVIAVAVLAVAGFVLTGLSAPPTEVAYQNDSYQVPAPDKNPPPLPVPETYEEAAQLLVRSPFYAQSVPIPVRCDTRPINVSSASDTQLKSHFDGMMACLVRVWEPPITDAGFTIVRPSVTIYGSKVTTRCGTSKVNAFYCAADQQVYYSNQLADDVPIIRSDKWAADAVIAHEFGHALQARTGILISAKALGQQSGDEPTDLLFSRRLETQADCFSGMFLHSVSQSLGIQDSDIAGIQNTYRAVGDDVLTGDPSVEGNHGTARSRVYWGTAGLSNTTVSTCNTFTAPANQVS